MLPAYVPNPVAAATGGGYPIDGGRYWRDGRRIFGDGKTWRGLFIGIGGGLFIGSLQIAVQSYPALSSLPEHTLLSVLLLSAGALLGDLGKSFLKRRRNLERGAKWPVADQYDLVIGASILLVLFNLSWIISTITLPIALAILIITPLLHRGANLLGYALGIKEVPW
ncbi:hypothetical protein RJ53_00815 [Methanocalculus chunghsingensis]|uniref:CDP-archaeol synthase n=1 Tax=Methanocalculus chunghsingensis TaxID=156457 RepID=A0A8J8B3F0_9EURY|nr:CDP-2,3-bis-(O-geranylgeranyl)-sn-glycerol synthase [Methanocalculus chunghsingensis]MBR1368110.1 hypothetical protein [Methanocalculus chunghsingensis]